MEGCARLLARHLHAPLKPHAAVLQCAACLQGARKVEWSVRVPRHQNRGQTAPMFVGLMNDT